MEHKNLESGHFFLFGATANELLEILSEIRRISKYLVHRRDSDRGLPLPTDQSVALVNQRAKRMRCNIVICGLSEFTILFTLSHKRYDFQKKKILDLKSCLVLSTNLIRKISLSKRQ
jgi:hypothetical protein